MTAPAVVSGLCLSAIDTSAQTYVLQWTPSAGASVYNIYRSAVLYDSSSYQRVNRSGVTMTAFVVSYTELLPTVDYYFFVTALNAGGEESAKQSEGVTNEDVNAFTEDPLKNFTDTWGEVVYPVNADMGNYVDEMRRRETWMLQNDGVKCRLLKRKWQGDLVTAAMTRGGGLTDMIPSLTAGRTIRVVGAGNNTTDFSTYGEGVNFNSTSGSTMTTMAWMLGALQPPINASYWTRYQELNCECYESEAAQGKRGCTTCWGTWIPGGYVAFSILVSFAPEGTTVTYYHEGMRTTVKASHWTSWTPRIDPFDLIRVERTNKIYEVGEVTPTSWRGQYTTQDLTLKLLPPEHPAYRFPISDWPTKNIGANA